MENLYVVNILIIRNKYKIPKDSNEIRYVGLANGFASFGVVNGEALGTFALISIPTTISDQRKIGNKCLQI
jgi:hypothetical protein